MMLQRSNARSEIIVAFVEEVAANMVADDVHIFLDLVPEYLVYLWVDDVAFGVCALSELFLVG